MLHPPPLGRRPRNEVKAMSSEPIRKGAKPRKCHGRREVISCMESIWPTEIKAFFKIDLSITVSGLPPRFLLEKPQSQRIWQPQLIFIGEIWPQAAQSKSQHNSQGVQMNSSGPVWSCSADFLFVFPLEARNSKSPYNSCPRLSISCWRRSCQSVPPDGQVSKLLSYFCRRFFQ